MLIIERTPSGISDSNGRAHERTIRLHMHFNLSFSVYVIERFSLFTLKVVPITWHRQWVVFYFLIFFKFFAKFVRNFCQDLFLKPK